MDRCRLYQRIFAHYDELPRASAPGTVLGEPPALGAEGEA
jgi:hypothetical protein